jgi:hypothetical protein
MRIEDNIGFGQMGNLDEFGDMNGQSDGMGGLSDVDIQQLQGMGYSLSDIQQMDEQQLQDLGFSLRKSIRKISKKIRKPFKKVHRKVSAVMHKLTPKPLRKIHEKVFSKSPILSKMRERTGIGPPEPVEEEVEYIEEEEPEVEEPEVDEEVPGEPPVQEFVHPEQDYPTGPVPGAHIEPVDPSLKPGTDLPYGYEEAPPPDAEDSGFAPRATDITAMRRGDDGEPLPEEGEPEGVFVATTETPGLLGIPWYVWAIGGVAVLGLGYYFLVHKPSAK